MLCPTPSKLLEQLRGRIRVKHYSIRTEQAYVQWAKRYLFFHGMRHPAEMGRPEVESFLTALAVERNVTASTQNQALSALLFLYREVLKVDLPWLSDVIRAKKPARLPTVLTQEEVRALLKYVEFTRNEIVVRDGKGGKDRVTMLPASLSDRLAAHIAVVKAQHDADLALSRGEVWLPDALAVKYPNQS